MAQMIRGALEESARSTFTPPMADDSIKIAHLSDLHLGRRFDRVAWAHVCSKLEDWKPHVIVISGDLVNNPWPRSLLEAKLEIAKLTTRCKCKPLVVIVPGNHDIGLKGNVPIWFLNKLFFCIFYDGVDNTLMEQYQSLRDWESWLGRTRLYWSLMVWCMKRRFQASKEMKAFPKFMNTDCHLWLAAINSNQINRGG